jgi:chromosome segregation ATPase
MLIWVFAAVCAGFLILTGRTWMEFTLRQQQLEQSIREQEELVTEHEKRLEQLKRRAEEVREQNVAKKEECDALDCQIGEPEENLKLLKAQLERVKPKTRQVDKNDNEDSLWRK